MEEKQEVKETKKKGSALGRLIKKCIVVFVPGIILSLILLVVTEAALGPTSTHEFCGELCHEMENVYETWKGSTHAKNAAGIQVECIECHLPPKDKLIKHVAAKAYTGTKDAFHHIVGTEYDAKAIRKKVREHMTNEVCMRCHNNMLENENFESADMHKEILEPEDGKEPDKCISCHGDAGHVGGGEDEDEEDSNE